MKIAIDASSAARGDGTGITNYTKNLLINLARLDKDNAYYICYRLSRLKKWKYLFKPPQDNFRLKFIQEPFNVFFQRRIDIFHDLDARLPAYNRVKKIVTVHDLNPLVSPDFASEDFLRMKIERYSTLAREADIIISVSESTKKEIIKYLNFPEDKIVVIKEGVGAEFFPISTEEIHGVKDKYNLRQDYLLFVGDICVRKNMRKILEAFSFIAKKVTSYVELVLVGKLFYGHQEILDYLKKLDSGSRVRLVGYVPQKDLPALYSGAKMFVFPSLYEGFGLPILESMACGTPVITSNVSACPEVAGDAAILVDPTRVEQIAEAMLRLLKDNELCIDLKKRGLERVKSFTWEKAAKKTLDVYRLLNIKE